MRRHHASAVRRSRRGFSLLEVVVALGILTVAMLLLVEIQSTAIQLTREAERAITASDLARMVLTDALIAVEEDGVQESDVFERGDFDDLGDDILDAQIGANLKEYHWEYAISEINIDMLGDLAQMGQDLDGALGGGGEDPELGGAPAGGGPGEMLGALGFGPEQISEMLGPYIREVRVRVWWGEDSAAAEETGSEVVLTTHVVNPTGVLQLENEVPL